MAKEMLPDEYLNKDFDYTKLTKDQLRKIMYENGAEDIPPPAVKKSELLKAYKKHVHDKIEINSESAIENPFQQGSNTNESEFFEVISSESVDAVVKSKSNVGKEISKNPTKVAISRSSAKTTVPISQAKVVSKDHKKTPIKSIKDIPKIEQEVSKKSDVKVKDDVSSTEIYSSPIKRTVGLATSSSATSSFAEPVISQSIINFKKFGSKIKSDVGSDGLILTPTVTKTTKDTSKSENICLDTNTHKSGIVIYVFIVLAMCIPLYLRFFCPYCKNGEYVCILPPKHSKVINGKLVCDNGFMVKRGILKNYCVKDNRYEKEVKEKAKDIKKILEKKNGDFIYGVISNKMVPIDKLTKEDDVVKALKNEKDIMIVGNMIYSLKRCVSMKTFIKYYAKKVFMIIAPLILVIVVFKINRSYINRKKEKQLTTRRIIKDITDVLVRQIYISAKNPNFSSHVYVEQLRDCFGVDSSIWKSIEAIISENSNIREVRVAEKRAWEWIGPILYKPEFTESLF